MSILRTAQSEIRKHSLDTFNDKVHGVTTPGCPHCRKSFYTISQLIDHLATDILPGILETAFATATKFVYCDNCKAVVEYEKSLLESEGRTGLEIVCKNAIRLFARLWTPSPLMPWNRSRRKRRHLARSAECRCHVGSMALMRLMCCVARSVTHCSSAGGSCATARGCQSE